MNKIPKIILKDALKTFTIDQDKVIYPEKTVSNFKEKIKSLNLDIIEDVIRIDNGRLDIPVYFSICGHDAKEIIGTKKQMGKGATPIQAEASAVMELAERFSFFSFCKNPDNFIIEKFCNLKDQAISFDMIAKSVHDFSDELKITKEIFEDIPLKWTWGYNLSQNKEVLIPFDWFLAINEFNGPSAGNCVEEAILQGICEITERHVCSLISQNKLIVPSIDLYSSDDPLVCEMILKYKKAGIKLYLSDFTFDMGIPTVGVLAYDPSTFPEKSEIVWTAGTTPCPQKALSRALTETAQLAGDFNTGSNYVASGLPKFISLDEIKFIINSNKKISIKELPNISNKNIKLEIENCINALCKKDMEVIVIDTMNNLLGIPAFYTIIPGAYFRERALGTSVGMFIAKIITQNFAHKEALQKLLEIDSKLKAKYYIKFYIGLSYLSLEHIEKALYFFNEALNFEPNKQDIASIYSYMGFCLKELKRYQEAISVLEKGIKFDEERTDIYNLLGYCYFKLKNHKISIDFFNKVIKLNPSSAIDYANIGSNYRDMGDRKRAIINYEMALSLDPSITFAIENLKKLKG